MATSTKVSAYKNAIEGKKLGDTFTFEGVEYVLVTASDLRRAGLIDYSNGPCSYCPVRGKIDYQRVGDCPTKHMSDDVLNRVVPAIKNEYIIATLES